MENTKLLHYIYFHCTKRMNPHCTQRSIKIEDLETLIDQELEKFDLSELFSQWALEELANDTEWQIKSQTAIVNSQEHEYKEVVARLLNLTKLYTSPANADGSLLSLDEYQPQRNELMARKKQLEKDREKTGRKLRNGLTRQRKLDSTSPQPRESGLRTDRQNRSGTFLFPLPVRTLS